MPTLVTIALPNGCFFTPSALIERLRSPDTHALKRIAALRPWRGSASIVFFVFANSGSSPAFIFVARAVSSVAISYTDFLSAFSTFTPLSERPPSTAVM